MYPQSTKFNNALLYSHKATVRVEVYDGIGGKLIYSTKNLDLQGGLLDGEVSIQDSAIRRRVNLKLIDPIGGKAPDTSYTIIYDSQGAEVNYDANIDYDSPIFFDGFIQGSVTVVTPPAQTALEDIFQPYGNEVRIYRGIQFVDGKIEEIPLGVFGISQASIDDSGSSLIVTVDAFDRARAVSRATLVQDYYIEYGTPFTVAIQRLINNQVPRLDYNFVSMSYATPELVVPTGADPWKVAQQMAAAIGCEIFFDVVGTCTLRTIPDYSISPITWSYKEGAEAILLYTNKLLTSDNTYNYYIVTGENSGNVVPIRGDAFDDNPASITYWKGKYGTVPAPVVSTKMVQNQSQALQAARGLLQKSIGKAERIHFNALVNPGHEIGDVVEIVRQKSKIDNRYVIGQLSIPLSKDRAMDIVSRVRQGVSI